MNLMDVFCETVERQPDHPAIIGPKDEDILSYKQLKDEIESTAQHLKEAGVLPGQCIGLHYLSGRDYIIYNYAIWRCNAVVVPIAMEQVPEEKQRICREIAIDSIISQKATVRMFEPVQKGKPLPISDIAIIVPIRHFRDHPSGFADVNTAFLRFSSGTTGTSKGVVLSHKTIYERINAANEVLNIGADDNIIWLLSMSYHFAVSIVSYLSFGAGIVLCKNHFGATIIQTAVAHKGTIIYGSPMQYELMAHDQGSQMLPDLRMAISTTISLKRKTATAFFARFQKPLTQAYGIIEVGLPFININKSLEKLDSVGRVLPAYEIRMDDVGLKNDLKAIKLRGKGFFNAYYEPWQTFNEITNDGWFSTGDLGMLDNDGYLFILGRTKEIINIAGMKIFPQEVEAVLESHPAVKEACVFPHLHDAYGEIPYAHIVVKQGTNSLPSEAHLKHYCIQHLTPYKIPDKIIFVDSLKRTASGKLIRDEERIWDLK